MRGTGSRKRLDDEEMAFAATVVVLVGLLLVATLFFGSVFVAPLG